MNAFLVPVLIASLGGSLHCAAMCGPTMAAVSRFGPEGRAGLSTQAAYHLGRLTTYLALGAFGGLLGGTLDLAGNAAGVGRVSAIVADHHAYIRVRDNVPRGVRIVIEFPLRPPRRLRAVASA